MESDDAGGRAAPLPIEQQLAEAREALAARDRLLAERTRRLHALEELAARSTVTTARLESVSAELAALHLARRTELAERDARIARLELRLAEAELAGGPPSVPDDLKRIRGIGPVIETLLHDMGITSFRQIAALRGETLRQVGDLLGVFRGRIQQDRWIEQAAELLRRPDHDRPGRAPAVPARPDDSTTDRPAR